MACAGLQGRPFPSPPADVVQPSAQSGPLGSSPPCAARVGQSGAPFPGPGVVYASMEEGVRRFEGDSGAGGGGLMEEGDPRHRGGEQGSFVRDELVRRGEGRRLPRPGCDACGDRKGWPRVIPMPRRRALPVCPVRALFLKLESAISDGPDCPRGARD